MNRYLETLREAKATAGGLILLVVFWIAGGIGLSKVDMYIYHIPLWAVVGTLGVWIFAVVLALRISRNIKDVNLK